ncbi:MAG: VWA domain-containing protein [Acidobacteria bacterium]|nr:VWA domain-containing protein [Acidobacteriota bacterium]
MFKTQDSFAVAAAGLDWSQDKTTLNNYIDSLSIVTGQTALFDAVESTAAAFGVKIDAVKVAPENRVLILITDGDDRIQRRAPGISQSSQDQEDRWRKARDQVIKKLKGMGITVYAIGLTRELEADGLIRVSARDKAETFLSKLAKQTGGRAVISRTKRRYRQSAQRTSWAVKCLNCARSNKSLQVSRDCVSLPRLPHRTRVKVKAVW